MHTAKIIRHRHKIHHFLNEDLKSVEEETHFKIVFSHPNELTKFEDWCKSHHGNYDYDKENSRQKGKMPEVPLFEDEICWCDIMTYYILHVAGYTYHSSLHPYKGEVYVKNGTYET
ncbi:MAG: hypothetical protein JWN78_3133 [Bacteroidota bacterium]|nr:hypothetical protein [Bacteroidota bacterium]